MFLEQSVSLVAMTGNQYWFIDPPFSANIFLMIHNEINIDGDQLSQYFKTHTLRQCAERFSCSRVTIKRKLRALNVDTSIHNHSDLAVDAYRRTVKDTSFLTEELLRQKYLIENKDTKSIAEECNLHHNTIRNKIKKFGFKKDHKSVSDSMMVKHFEKTGYYHPGQRPDVIDKMTRSRFIYKPMKSNRTCSFKSLHELCYALLLDLDPQIINWDYELIRIPYVDGFTGKKRIYYVDFSVQSNDGDRWVEVKPNDGMIPQDKFLYASHAAKNSGITFRGITKEEDRVGFELFLKGVNFDRIEFKNKMELKLHKKYTLWFKTENGHKEITNDHYQYQSKQGAYWKCTFVPKAANKMAAVQIRRSDHRH